MKKLITAVLALAMVACGQKNIPLDPEVEVGPYTITNISSGIYHIQDYNTANPAGEEFDAEGNKTHFNNCSDMYLLVGKTDAPLVDLSNRIRWADNAEESLRSIVSDRISDKPLTITFTHNHGDHTGMMPAYVNDPDVKFALPRKDFEMLVSRFPGIKYEMYDDGKKFDLGGISVTSVEVPGHTAGSMVFFIDGLNLMLSGDAIGSGHGVWIFNSEAFGQYYSAVPQLISFIEDPANGIDTASLKIYGGHYWQRDWLEAEALSDAAAAALGGESSDSTAVCKKGSGTLAPGEELGYSYIQDMQALLDEMSRGEAYTEPSGLGRPGLETYFRHGLAIITWSADQAAAFFSPVE